MEEVVVPYLVCKRCGEKGCYVEENREQGVISKRKLEEIKWCGCIGKEMHGQESWKAQQRRGVVKERSGEPSRC